MQVDNTRPGVKNIIQLYVISENLASLALSFQTEQEKTHWIECFNRSLKAFFDGKSSNKVTEALDILEKDLQSFRSRSLKDRVAQRASLSPTRKRLEYNLSSVRFKRITPAPLSNFDDNRWLSLKRSNVRLIRAYVRKSLNVLSLMAQHGKSRLQLLDKFITCKYRA